MAAMAGLAALSVGAWPFSLVALFYLFYSFRPKGEQSAPGQGQGAPIGPRRPWGRYLLGVTLFLLSAVAFGAGGTLSPIVFCLGGLAVLLWPAMKKGMASRVAPVKESVLLRSTACPLLWYSMAEVKLESQGQTRGITALDGSLLFYSGKATSVFLLVRVRALGCRRAEEEVVRAFRMGSRMLSQRGAHLLPLDSSDAAQKLSFALERLHIGTCDVKGLASLHFDVLALRAREGAVVSRRAFLISEPAASPFIPDSDLPLPRPPLLAEVVDAIGERHGWQAPDEYSAFLAAMDAARGEPLADKIRTKGESEGKVAVETPGGTEVMLTRAQLRAVARIYT
ncbi:MAG: hypothetical protein JRN44_01415 [Nitrososphaerota archaeon]|nr:hypothetical protein [Nitrososphaerota archaeon]